MGSHPQVTSASGAGAAASDPRLLRSAPVPQVRRRAGGGAGECILHVHARACMYVCARAAVPVGTLHRLLALAASSHHPAPAHGHQQHPLRVRADRSAAWEPPRAQLQCLGGDGDGNGDALLEAHLPHRAATSPRTCRMHTCLQVAPFASHTMQSASAPAASAPAAQTPSSGGGHGRHGLAPLAVPGSGGLPRNMSGNNLQQQAAQLGAALVEGAAAKVIKVCARAGSRHRRGCDRRCAGAGSWSSAWLAWVPRLASLLLPGGGPAHYPARQARLFPPRSTRTMARTRAGARPHTCMHACMHTGGRANTRARQAVPRSITMLSRPPYAPLALPAPVDHAADRRAAAPGPHVQVGWGGDCPGAGRRGQGMPCAAAGAMGLWGISGGWLRPTGWVAHVLLHSIHESAVMENGQPRAWCRHHRLDRPAGTHLVGRGPQPRR